MSASVYYKLCTVPPSRTRDWLSDGSSRRHEDESENTQNNNVTAVVDTGHKPCMDDLELNFARITTSS